MGVSIRKARDFVFGNGALWERALYTYLFEHRTAGRLEHLHQCLLCYKNSDYGWGHGLECDIKCPDSNPLQLEFLLQMVRDTGIPVGHILDGTPAWVESNRNPDGSLRNPPTLLDYPHAPWWSGGGQTAPDSITGNLTRLGMCTPSLAESTRRWVQENVTLQKIKANDWLFMAYHAHDYFLNVYDFPNIETYRAATIQTIVALAERAPEKQYYVLFTFATRPDSPVAKAIPPHIIARNLDYLAASQRDDGGWDDENGLLQWQPYATIVTLLALRRFGRLN